MHEHELGIERVSMQFSFSFPVILRSPLNKMLQNFIIIDT